MVRMVLFFLSILASVPAAAQTNPCAAALPPGTVVTASTALLATLPEHTTSVAGVAVVTEYEFGIFLPGVDPSTGQPVTRITIPKASWTLRAGTTDCYEVKPSELLAIPINADRRGALKAKRTTPDVVESAWSSLSNPFGRMGAPAVPTGTRVTP